MAAVIDLRQLPTDELRWRILRSALDRDWPAWAHARLELHRRLVADRKDGVLFTQRDADYGGGSPEWQTDPATDFSTPPLASSEPKQALF